MNVYTELYTYTDTCEPISRLILGCCHIHTSIISLGSIYPAQIIDQVGKLTFLMKYSRG